jgi:hypothetical protein
MGRADSYHLLRLSTMSFDIPRAGHDPLTSSSERNEVLYPISVDLLRGTRSIPSRCGHIVVCSGGGHASGVHSMRRKTCSTAVGQVESPQTGSRVWFTSPRRVKPGGMFGVSGGYLDLPMQRWEKWFDWTDSTPGHPPVPETTICPTDEHSCHPLRCSDQCD